MEAFQGTSSVQFAQLLSNTTNAVFSELKPVFTRTLVDADETLKAIENLPMYSAEQTSQVRTLFAVIQDSVFDNFGIEPPEVKNVELDPNEEWAKNHDAFKLIVCPL